jgi:hypothetical protein
MASKKDVIEINGQKIGRGESKKVISKIARLPSGTEIELPIYVFRSNKPGPAVLMSAGLHGDEINGIEIVRRMLEDRRFEKLERGTVVAIPVMNIYGFLNFSRQMPDGKDINRNFPGNANGSLASRIAHFLTKEVLPVIDMGVDFHTGGASRFNFPQVRFAQNDNMAIELAHAFGSPVLLQSALIEKSLRKQAFKLGKSIVVYEGGESLRLDEEVINEGMDGASRLLLHHEMLLDAPPRTVEPLLCESSIWIRARRSGIYKGLYRSGMSISRKETLGFITDPFGDFSVKVKAPQNGFIIGHNNMPIVNQGDALLHLGLLKTSR